VDTNRLEAFSDGVFAIAITLLILEIKVPAPEVPLAVGLSELWPSYLAYAVSFIVIGAIWINHHAMFEAIDHIDTEMLLLNTLHLLFIAFLPFPTAVLAQAFHERHDESLAAAFYGGVLTIIGILVTSMWFYACHNRRLLSASVSEEEARRAMKRYLIGPTGYAISTVTAFASPRLAVFCFVALNVFFLWPRRKNKNSAG
jgi:uncharacterized membrane protein